jgi:acetyl esterase/lipase
MTAFLMTGLSMVQGKPSAPDPDEIVVYKTVNDIRLEMHIYKPKDWSRDDRRPAIVFFHGGSWKGGHPRQFYAHCRYLADHGMVAMSAQYRLTGVHGTTPYDCVTDGHSAVRWIREHAGELGVDPGKVVAGGGSAGGHVAAAVATTTVFEDPGEDKRISSVPAALVLFNPVYNNGPDGWGHKRVAERWQEISPYHNIKKGMPPAVVFFGTLDTAISPEQARAFKQKMEAVGSRSELFLYEGQKHGFFNWGGGSLYYRKTLAETHRFLASLGYLDGEPDLVVEEGKEPKGASDEA